MIIAYLYHMDYNPWVVCYYWQDKQKDDQDNM